MASHVIWNFPCTKNLHDAYEQGIKTFDQSICYIVF